MLLRKSRTIRESRNVRVALLAGGRIPVGHLCQGSKGPAVLESLHEIEVTDKRPPERDQGAVEHVSEFGQRHRVRSKIWEYVPGIGCLPSLGQLAIQSAIHTARDSIVNSGMLLT